MEPGSPNQSSDTTIGRGGVALERNGATVKPQRGRTTPSGRRATTEHPLICRSQAPPPGTQAPRSWSLSHPLGRGACTLSATRHLRRETLRPVDYDRYADVVDRNYYRWIRAHRRTAAEDTFTRADDAGAPLARADLQRLHGPLRPIHATSLIQDEAIALAVDAAGTKAVNTLAAALGAIWESRGGVSEDVERSDAADRALVAADRFAEHRDAVMAFAHWGRDLLYGPVLLINARAQADLVEAIGALVADPDVAYEIGATLARVVSDVASLRSDGYASLVDDWTDRSQIGPVARRWLDGD